MVYRRISADMKQRSLVLLEDGWDLDEVVEVLGVSKRSIRRWAQNYKQAGRVDPSKIQRGRHRLLNSSIMQELQELIAEAPSLYLDEIREWLAIFHNQPISMSALHYNLRDLGLTYKVLKHAAAQRDEAMRNKWIDDVAANFTPDQMVFTDESSKDGRTLLRLHGRSIEGERATEIADFDRGQRWSIVPALSLDGYIALRVVPGSVDGGEFFDFVVNDVVCSISSCVRIFIDIDCYDIKLPQMNPFPNACSVLIMDNCNTHKTEALELAVQEAGMYVLNLTYTLRTKYLSFIGCLLIFLPAYSPDLNPIEESFNVGMLFSLIRFTILLYLPLRYSESNASAEVVEIESKPDTIRGFIGGVYVCGNTGESARMVCRLRV